MKFYLFLGIVLFFSQGRAMHYTELVVPINSYEQLDCYNSLVTFLKDGSGKRYVVKQIKFKDKPFRLVKLICEMVALDIGHTIGVPLNKVCVIPAGVPFAGKDTAVPATVHALVPGIRLDMYQKNKKLLTYKGLDIKQKKPEGLSRRVITHMCRHADLSVLVALDTFVGNADRGQNNFFYDQKTDAFYGIDLAGSFSKNLCASSIKNIKEMLQDKKVAFSKQEGNGLLSYYTALCQLVETYDAERICACVDEHAQYAGFYSECFCDGAVQAACLSFIQKRKTKIRQHYASACQLVDWLQRLLQKHNLL